MLMPKQKLLGWTNGVSLNFRRHSRFHVLFDYVKDFRVWVVNGALSVSPFWLHLCYFSGICLMGLIPLRMSTTKSKGRLNLLDALYTCVSALTVTSLGSVRMEEFSEFQLSVLIVLMLLGGEVFTSMLCLHARRAAYKYNYRVMASKPENVESGDHGTAQMGTATLANHVSPIQNTGSRVGKNSLLGLPIFESTQRSEIGFEDERTPSSHPETEMVDRYPQKKMTRASFMDDKFKTEYNIQCMQGNDQNAQEDREQIYNDVANISAHEEDLECRLAITYISYIALIYLAVVQIVGILLITICFSFSPHRKKILERRGVKISIFAVFTTVSSFANCGFTPLDDNMLPFRKDAVLLFILAGQILLGNTMCAPCLRAIICALHRFRNNGAQGRVYEYILETTTKLYNHLFSRSQSIWLTLTVVGFVTAQAIIFCALHWKSEALEGLNTFEKVVSGIFQAVAMRHAGENVVDPQLLSHALIVFYIVMMYLPAYPIYFPERDAVDRKPPPAKIFGADSRKTIRTQLRKLMQNDPCYLIVAIIVICITERNKLSTDPLNYSVLHIVFEVVSAYGNVGISMGYSCRLFKRLSRARCEDVAFSFSGKWSAEGKAVIIIVMFIGRLKGIK